MADFEVVAYAGRTIDFTVSIKTASGGYVQLAVGDVVRVKIGRGSAEPDLDLDSAGASSNQSSVTIDNYGDGSTAHNAITVRVAQDDVGDLLGLYDVEVALVDDSETAPADAIKHAIDGVLAVLPSMAGDVGKT